MQVTVPCQKRDFSSRLEVTILQKIETRFLLPALRMIEGLVASEPKILTYCWLDEMGMMP